MFSSPIVGEVPSAARRRGKYWFNVNGIRYNWAPARFAAGMTS
jgi:hypothetical protein